MKDINKSKRISSKLFLLIFVLLGSGSALAGGNSPPEVLTGLQKLMELFAGPLALLIGAVALVFGVIVVFWQGEMNEFVKILAKVALGVSFIIGAMRVMNWIFGSGASIF